MAQNKNLTKIALMRWDQYLTKWVPFTGSVNALGQVEFSPPNFTKPQSGELAGSTSAAVMPNIPCSYVMFTAVDTNVGNVYIGAGGVTKPDATTDTTTGFLLTPDKATPWIPIDNLNRLSYITDNAGDEVIYFLV